jgi:hypothetical protein
MVNINIKLRFWITLLMLFYFTFIIFCFLDSYLLRIKINDGYVVGDWVINYQDGGFKARGLSGTIILFISDVTGLFIGKIIFGINLILYGLFGCLTSYLLSRIWWKIEHVLFLLLPTSFLFLINDEYAVGRKETILYVLFLFFLIFFDKIKKNNKFFLFIFSALFLIALFFHELILFYFPYFILVLIIDYKINNEKVDFKKIVFFSLLIIVPSMFIFFLGGDLNQGNTWLILKKYGLSQDVMTGILSWPKKVNVLAFAKEHNYYLYSVPLIFTYIVILFSILRLQLEKKTKVCFIVLVLFIFIFTFPLFFLAIDWGRWIHIHVIMIVLTYFYFSKNNNLLFFESVNINVKIAQLFYLLAFTIVGLILLFFTTMKHVDDGFVIGNSNTYIELKNIYYNILQWFRS